MIICRNMLIYFEPPAETRILPIFHDALNRSGFLMLGPSEAMSGSSELFSAVNRNHNIYASTKLAADISVDPSEDYAGLEPESSVRVTHVPEANQRARERLVVQLERELDGTRESLQAIIDEQDATIAELQSANAELLSSNEVFEMVNEELQTAKEEQQATNADLFAMNEMLDRHTERVSGLASDLANILASINLPIVMLSSDLRLRRFTPEAERVLKLTRAHLGRRLSDLDLNLDTPELERVIAEVIDAGSRKANAVKDRDGRWWSMRVLPYRNAEGVIDGAVLYLVDIDDLRRSLVIE